jgi:hypothetical protein
MKWQKYFVVNFSAEDVDACKHVTAWKIRYGIPCHRCFSLGGPSRSDCLPLYPLTSGSFAEADYFSKLIIVSHGNEWSINCWTPPELAQRLCEWGLRHVGLISIKSCQAGRGRYLDELAYGLACQSIGFGWLIGYRGFSRLEGSSLEKAYEVTSNEDAICRSFGVKLPDPLRIRILRGNVAVSNPYSPRFM